MSLLKKIINGLKSDRTPYQPSLLEFPAVDPIKLRRDLKVQERGTERGKREEPPTTIGGLDDVEHTIVGAMEGFKAQAESSLRAHLETYSGRLAKLGNESLVDTIDHELKNAVVDFRTGVRTDATRLYLPKKHVIEAEHEYEVFRKSHRLARTAKYPSHWFKNIAITLLFALIDTIANAVFFSQTHPRGWLGAIFESIFISAINVIVGFASGYFLARGCHSLNKFAKIASASLLMGFLGFLLLANTFAAHYRDAFASLSPEAMLAGRDLASAEALKRLIEHRWVLLGFQSYLMVVIGMVVALLSLYEGYRFDDALPGFGAVARNRQRHLNAYAEAKEYLISGLKERKDDALRDIEYLKEEVRRRDEEFATVLEGRRTIIQRYNSFLLQLEHVGNQLLEAYRSANRAARSTAPPPTFDTAWNPGWRPHPVPSDPPTEGRMEETRKLTKRLSEAPMGFLEAYADAIKEYDRIDEIMTAEALKDATTIKA